ncbi:hypothetical protein [Sulfurovum riftiae]|uniref:Uncharacterized protein n=1 Tax=Sulfurovum riftiae TaxID=1630136 RepID=A0A151CJ45_9BACT|nr:hypothetical protein [Sulfurovum riftiae]KYJ87531.1 hypothetical protein AS592_10515 [Sulfurovum riftiae]
MSSTVYAVMELSGNFAHTLEEFDNIDEAAEFMLDKATEDAQEAFTVHKTEVPAYEWEEALENALSYYNIEEWKVAS